MGTSEQKDNKATLEDALVYTSKVHGVGFPQHLIYFKWMSDFHHQVIEQEDESDVDKSRLVICEE